MKLLALGALAACVVCGPTDVFAETATSTTKATTDDAKSADVSSTQLQEVVVTAQKRSEDVQHIGVAVTALSGEAITDARIRQPLDLASLTPGLSTVNMTVDGTPTFAIRGVGLDDFNENDSSPTAVYFDGIYQSAPGFLEGQMFDVSRAEVLKGPQGTLYGKNASGGAVSIVSNAPEDQLDGYITAGYGRWQTSDVSGAITGPIAQGLTARLAGTYTYSQEGFQKDLETGERYGAARRGGLRAMLAFAPNDIFKSVLSLHYSHDNSIPSSYQARNDVVPGCAVCGPQFDTGTTDPTVVKVNPNFPLRRDNDAYGFSLNTDVDLGFASLASILGYDALRIDQTDNNQGIGYWVYNLYQNDHVRQFYEETRLTSSQPLFGKTNWIVGTSYSWQQFHGQDASDQSTSFVGLSEDPPDLNTGGLSIAQADAHQNPTSIGVFLNTTTSITDAFRFILGGRYSHDKLYVHGISTEDGSANGGVLFQGVGASIVDLNNTVYNDLYSYRVGVEDDLTKGLLFYANVSTGNKAGQYYLGPALDPANWQYAKPEKLLAYETGLKWTALDRRLFLDGSIFYYDYADRQSSLAFVSPITGFLVASIGNVPKSRVYGAEVDLMARPTHDLTFNVGVSFLDSAVTQTLFSVDGEPLLSNIPVGATLAQSPRFTVTSSAKYEHPLTANVVGSVHLDYRYSDAQKNTLADPNGGFGPDNVLNGRLSATYSTGLELALWGHNLTNSNATTNAYSSFFGQTIYRMVPITYGIEVTQKF
jgi:iron complex outermembrane receptor protein